MNYLLPAIHELGQKILDSAGESAGNEVVRFGKQLLQTLLRRKAKGDPQAPELAVLQSGIERRVRTLGDDPAQQKVAAQLEGSIEELLLADPALLPAIHELLARAPLSSVTHGAHSVHVGHDNVGIVISGNHNAVTSHTRRG